MARLLFTKAGYFSPRWRARLAHFFGLLEAAGHTVGYWQLPHRWGDCTLLDRWDLSLSGVLDPRDPAPERIDFHDRSIWDLRQARDMHKMAQYLPNRLSHVSAVDFQAQVSSSVFDHFNPTHFFPWNPNFWYFGIAAEIASKRGIRVSSMEAGLLPDSLHIDTKGYLWTSDLTLVSNSGQRSESDLLLKPADWDLYAQEASQEDKEAIKGDYVLLLTCSDHESGEIPEYSESRCQLLPHHHDLNDLVRTLTEATTLKTVVKAHPYTSRLPQIPDRDSVVLSSAPPISLLKRASAVVAYGTKLEMAAAKMAKPLVYPGWGFLRGRGVCHEADSREDFKSKIIQAVEAGPPKGSRRSFEEFCTALGDNWLLMATEEQQPLGEFLEAWIGRLPNN